MKRYLFAALIVALALLPQWVAATRSSPPLAPIPVNVAPMQEVVGPIALTRVWDTQPEEIENLVLQFSAQGWALSAIDRRYPFGFDYAALVTLYFHPQAAPVVQSSTPVQSAEPAVLCQDYDPSKAGIQGPFPGAKCVNGGWR